MAQTICNQCGAWYSSDHELRDHMATFHRKFNFANEEDNDDEDDDEEDKEDKEDKDKDFEDDGEGGWSSRAGALGLLLMARHESFLPRRKIPGSLVASATPPLY